LTLGTAAYAYTQARGFGTINEDFSVRKGGTIGDKYRVYFRAELFNAFNRTQYSGPNTSVTNINFGQVTGVSGNRTAQLGIRLDF
jgi:hypothetical protein